MGHTLSFHRSLTFAIVLLTAGMAVAADESTVFSPREKAFYADAAQVAFIRPGLLITINSAPSRPTALLQRSSPSPIQREWGSTTLV